MSATPSKKTAPLHLLLSDPSTGTVARASSVLQKNNRQYGPMNALTKDAITCWNSQGKTATSSSGCCWFLVDFQRLVRPQKLCIQFQAGFCGESAVVECKTSGGDWELVDSEVELEDVHEMQMVDLKRQFPPGRTTTAIKIAFEDFTDFYERVTIYQLEVWGDEGMASK